MIDKKTLDYLDRKFSDSLKREIDADEAVWRSLPFFAAVLGLAVAVLPAIYRSMISEPRTAWTIIGLIFFAAAAISPALRVSGSGR